MSERSQHRSRAASAAAAALALAILLFVQDLIGTASSTLIGFSPDDVASGYFGFMWLQQLLGYGLPVVLAFAGGVFLSLWLLAPTSHSLTVAQALLRGLLAAAVGAGAVLLVSFGIGMIGPMSGAGPLFGHSFPWPDLNATEQVAITAVRAAIRAFAQQAPAVMLVVVLGRFWVRKHPSPHAVSADAVQV